MSKDTSEPITEDFLEMLKSLTKTALKASATILNYRLEKKWEQFIDEFYESYEPSLYDRTGSTYEASNMYDKNLPELKNNRLAWKWKAINPTKNNSIIAGIEIDYKNIGDNPYKADTHRKDIDAMWDDLRSLKKNTDKVSSELEKQYKKLDQKVGD